MKVGRALNNLAFGGLGGGYARSATADDAVHDGYMDGRRDGWGSKNMLC